MSNEVRCRELLAGFHSGSLRGEEGIELQRLVDSDATRARWVAEDLLLDRLLGHALVEAATRHEFAQRVRERIERQRRTGPNRKARFQGVFGMAAALLLIGVTFWATFRHSVEERGIHTLIPRLSSKEVKERQDAERDLLALGSKVIPSLEEAAGSKDAGIAREAASMLATVKRMQEEKDWDRRVKALPETSGTREFTWGNTGATITMKTSLRGDDLLMENEHSVVLNGKRTTIWTVKTVCSADHTFSPHEFSVEETDDVTGKKRSWSGKFKDGKVKVTGDRTKDLDVTAKTVSDTAFYRMLWTLPTRVGFEYEFDLFGGLRLQPGQRLTCVGEEEVEIHGRKVKAAKWEFALRLPEVVGLYSLEYYWVANGKVVKADSPTRPGRTMVLAEQ